MGTTMATRMTTRMTTAMTTATPPLPRHAPRSRSWPHPRRTCTGRVAGTTTGTTTSMTTATATSTDPAGMDAPTLLRLMWLASPALPVGGFSYSEGLEAAVEAGHVHDEASGRRLAAAAAAADAGPCRRPRCGTGRARLAWPTTWRVWRR